MNDLFWLRKNLLAGSAGPNRTPWDYSLIAANNIGRVLSVNDGSMIRKADLAENSIDYGCFPLSSSAPPEAGDFEHCLSILPRALEFVLSPLPDRGATLVHCSSGKDRTGLFMSYYLCVVEGCSADEAVKQVRAVRPIAFSAFGWDSFVCDILEHISSMRD